MNKNNKGYSQIIVLIVFVLLVSGGIGWYYYTRYINTPKESSSQNKSVSENKSDLVEPYTNKPYYKVGFIKFKLPELKPEFLDKEINNLGIKNEEGKNCFKKEYFQNRGIKKYSYNNLDGLFLEFGKPIGKPICIGAPGPYIDILFAVPSESTLKNFDNKEFYNFVKRDFSSSKDITVYENISEYASVGKDYFLIQDNNNSKNKIVITMTPTVSSDKNLFYLYVKEVIKTMGIAKISEFKGLQNCPQNECKNLSVDLLNGQLIFLDQDLGVLYKTNTEISDDLSKVKFDKNSIYFTKTTLNSKHTEPIEWKLSSINVKNGEITELITLKEDLKDYLIADNKIYYATGKGCGEVCPENKNTYFHKLFSYDLLTKKTELLNKQNLTDSGYVISDPNMSKFDLEAGRLQIYQLEGNKLTMSFGQVIQTAEAFFYFDLITKKVTNIDGNKYYYGGGDELIKKRIEYGFKNGVLLIRNGEILREN